MTNTNDFRRYSYSSDTSYAVQMFNAQRASTAPSVKRQPKEKLKVRENTTVKSMSVLKSEQSEGFKRALKIAVVAFICFAMITSVIYSLALKNELTRQISAQEVEIANAESEYISLESELNSLVSISMIDKYAVEELGMVKVKSSQIQYMDVEQYKAQRQKMITEQSPGAMAEQVDSNNQ